MREVRKTERILKALANKRRLAILSFLKNRKGANVGEIAENIKLSYKSTSKHIGILSSVGIVVGNEQISHVIYRIDRDLPWPAEQIVWDL